MANRQEFFRVCVEADWHRLTCIDRAMELWPDLGRARIETEVDRCFDAVALVPSGEYTDDPGDKSGE